jgi:hypothetical protein
LSEPPILENKTKVTIVKTFSSDSGRQDKQNPAIILIQLPRVNTKEKRNGKHTKEH